MREALYLDDEVLIGLDGQFILEQIGFTSVHLVHNSDEALAVVNSRTIAFALLDVNLGRNQTSLPLARELERRGIVFAFVSGYNRDEDLTGSFTAPFVSKPFSHATVQTALNDALTVERLRQ
ncbi:MAG: hypothetical protein AAF318_06995 [Pseudomonadota bacterium]